MIELQWRKAKEGEMAVVVARFQVGENNPTFPAVLQCRFRPDFTDHMPIGTEIRWTDWADVPFAP